MSISLQLYNDYEMIHVSLSVKEHYPLPFYLAMEEYVAREFPAQDYFFMWQVKPTVIFGRNQLLETEVDTAYCREHSIEFYRRKSGGGCVYADMSNIMLSYITPDTNVNFTFNRYMLMVEGALRRLGVDVRTSGRNDILLDGKKLSGNAFYRLPGRSIVHGTLLYDTDLETMARATTPSNEKLKSKGVESVRQCVTTLNRYIALSIEELKHHLRHSLCSGELLLTADDISAIREIEQGYYDPEFLYGNNPACGITKRKRFEGVGEFMAVMELKENVIRRIDLSGDFFIIGDLDGMLLSRLKGVPFEPTAVEQALHDVDTSLVIRNFDRKQLINLLFD